MELKKLFDEFDEDIVRDFVQKNADYYLSKWKAMADSGSTISWNWAGFFLNVYWMMYRKMYLMALAIYLIAMIGTIIPLVGFFVGVLIWLAGGVSGNYLYGRYVFSKLLDLQEKFGSDKELFKQHILKSGGTSTSLALIFFIISIIISIISIAINLFKHY